MPPVAATPAQPHKLKLLREESTNLKIHQQESTVFPKFPRNNHANSIWKIPLLPTVVKQCSNSDKTEFEQY